MPHDGSISRRGFVAGLGAALAWAQDLSAIAHRLDTLPAGQDRWRIVREAFLIPKDRIYLNVGTLGAQPRVVVDAVVEHTRAVAETFPPAAAWDALEQNLGALLNVDGAGFVFPRNTTEGMSFVANGLELSTGDEILTTNHEHIGGLCCWQLVAKRHDLVLRQLPLPDPPGDAEQVLDLFRRALTPRTRVVSVSHVNFTNGLVMPIREIISLCRSRGIVSVIDGAHPPGLMRVDLSGALPDFYASSPHKWLLAPQGTGLLWMGEEWRTRLWPTLASGGWDDLSLGAHRFNHMGTFDESRLAGFLAALHFHEAIGADAIELRIRELRRRIIDGLSGIPGIQFMSPQGDEHAAGMVAFRMAMVPALELQRRLSEITAPEGTPLAGEHLRIRTRVVSEYQLGWMRLSPHIYNSMEEIDTVTAIVRAAI
jgi:selenocysteine lyase/cysteine desulfurase